MKLTLGQLKRIIYEAGLDSDMRNMAGSAGTAAGGIGWSDTSNLPPPGLGSPEEQDDNEDGKEQEKSQWAARVNTRFGRSGR